MKAALYARVFAADQNCEMAPRIMRVLCALRLGGRRRIRRHGLEWREVIAATA